MANNDDIQFDLNQDQAGQVIQNVAAGAQTTLAFRVDQSKIPEFWGQKAKDTVTAIVFIRKIEDLARTNHWTDTATYANVANAFKGFAREWLIAKADMLDRTEVQLTWTNLKPRFQKQFATQTDDKQIIEGLSNLKPPENCWPGSPTSSKKVTWPTTTRPRNNPPTLMGSDMWDCWRIQQGNGPTTRPTTCCNSSRCSFLGLPCQET